MWKNGVLRCKDKIREKLKSLAFDEKTKINISKDYLIKYILMLDNIHIARYLFILLLMATLLTSCSDDMPANVANTFAGLVAIWGEVILAILAMLIGIGMIAMGCWLTYAGYTGDYQLQIKGASLEASLVNATPGVLLIVLGVVVIIYRAKINIKLRK